MTRWFQGRQRAFARFASCAGVVAALLVAPGIAAPAFASVGCNGSSCDAQDPQSEGCASDARDLDEFTYYDLRVELRYSPACQATWARFNGTGQALPGVSYVDLIVWTAQSGGSQLTSLSSRYEDSHGNVAFSGWTDMWSYSSWSQACASGNSSWATNASLCTARH